MNRLDLSITFFLNQIREYKHIMPRYEYKAFLLRVQNIVTKDLETMEYEEATGIVSVDKKNVLKEN